MLLVDPSLRRDLDTLAWFRRAHEWPMRLVGGPAPLLDYFRIASRIQALEEAGLPVDEAIREELVELRQLIRPYYEQGPDQ